jgi:hypothetical protein
MALAERLCDDLFAGGAGRAKNEDLQLFESSPSKSETTQPSAAVRSASSFS